MLAYFKPPTQRHDPHSRDNVVRPVNGSAMEMIVPLGWSSLKLFENETVGLDQLYRSNRKIVNLRGATPSHRAKGRKSPLGGRAYLEQNRYGKP